MKTSYLLLPNDRFKTWQQTGRVVMFFGFFWRKTSKNIPALCFFFFTLLLSFHARAVESIASGNWASPAIWSTGVVPTSGIPVVIHSGHSISVNDNQSCGALTLEAGGSLNIQITGSLINAASNVSGTLTIFGQIGLPQSFNIGTGGLVEFAAGTHVFNSATSFTGGGTLKIKDAAAFGTTVTFQAGAVCTTMLNLENGTLNSDADIQPGAFTFSNGTYQGSGNLSVTGNFNWTGGVFDGSGTINCSGTTDLTPSPLYLKGSKVLEIGGMASLNALVLEGTARLKVLSGGHLTLGSSATAIAGTATNEFILESGGTLTKTGANTLNTQPKFTCNGGTINVNGGTLRFQSATNQTIENFSAINIANGAFLNISAGNWSVYANIAGEGTFKLFNSPSTVTLEPGSSFSSNTKLEITGTFTDNQGITPGAVLLMGATYNGIGSPEFAHGFSWDNADIGGSGTLLISGTMSNPIGGQTRIISGSKRVVLTGTATFTNAGIATINAGCVFEVAAGGVLHVDATILDAQFGTGGAGKFELTGGSMVKTGSFNMNIGSLYTQTIGSVSLDGGGRFIIRGNNLTHTISGGSVSLAGNSRFVFYNSGAFNVSQTTFSGSAGSVETSGDNNSSYPTVTFGNGATISTNFINTRGIVTFNTGASLTGSLNMVTQNFSILYDNVGLSPGNFTFSGGYYAGSGSPVFANGLTWTQGQFGLSGSITVSGSLSSSGTLAREMYGTCILTFTGTGNFNDRFPSLYDNAQFIIAGGTLGMNMASSFTSLGSATAKMEVQGGTLNRTGNGHASLPYKFIMAGGNFNHSDGGSTRLSGANTHAWTGGSVVLNDFSGIHLIGSTLDLMNTQITSTTNPPAITIGSSSGAGILNIHTNSTVTTSINLVRGSVVDNVGISAKEVYIGSGTYNGNWSGTGNTSATAGLFWLSGTITGDGEFNAHPSVSSFTPGIFSRTLGGSRHLKIYGTLNYLNSGYTMSGTAKTTVMTGGTLSLNAASSFSFGGSAANTLEVNGAVLKTGNSNVTIPFRFLINGAININAGSLHLTSTAIDNAFTNANVSIADGGNSLIIGVVGSSCVTTCTGTSFSGANGTFNAQGGSTYFNAGTSLTCRLSVVSGSVTDNVGLTPGFVSLGGEYRGNSSPTFANGFTWSDGGKLLGSGTVTVSGTVNVMGFLGATYLEIREDKELHFTTAASKTMTGGGFQLFDNAKVRVSSGAALVFAGNSFFGPAVDVNLTGEPATAFIVDAGCTLTKSDASWTLGINLPFQNNGVLEVTGGTADIWQGATHAGTFNVGAGCQLRYRTNSAVQQHIANNGTVTVDAGQTLTLNGTAAQTISGDGTFNGDLVLDNANGLTFSGAQIVNGNLRLQNGKATLLANDLTINSISNFSADRYVVTSGAGNLRLTVAATPTTFPVGPTTASYNPLQIAQPAGSDVYAVHVQTGFNAANPPAGADYVNRQWTIARSPANTEPADVTWTWNSPADQSGAFDPNNCHAGRWDGSGWQPFPEGAASCSGGICTRSQSGINVFSPFGIGSGAAMSNCTSLSNPLNGATDVPVATALTWAAASASATGYRLDAGATPGGTDILNNFDAGNVLTYDPPGNLPYSAVIYVKIKPYTALGNSVSCATESFTTACQTFSFYADNDGDSYGAGDATIACTSPPGSWVLNDADCDDADALEFPGQVWYQDLDGDDYSDGTNQSACLRPSGFFVATELTALSGDCDDADPTVFPGAPEFCDNLDNDCDGDVDEGITPHPDYDALLALYNSTDGANWSINSGWAEGAAGANCDPCTWFGVTCDAGGRVYQLNLNGFGLNGTLPADLGELEFLQYLELAGNQLSGSIPAALGELAALSYLDINTNQLSGSIPAALGDLANLNYLYLNDNQLSGSIPAALGDLASLNELNLSGNQLSGSVPTALGNLAQLYYLNLSNNQLSSSIPAALSDLVLLNELYLSDNQLSGSIPPELGDLTNLYLLYLHNNQVSGSIPAALGNIEFLYELNLSGNQLSGSIPAVLGDIEVMYNLNLSGNQLSGSIPLELGNLVNLIDLNLSNNQLSGCFPALLNALCSANVNLLGNAGLPGGGDFAAFCAFGEGVDADLDSYCTPDDCDDASPLVHPGAVELCDGLDNNCDGLAETDGYFDPGAGGHYGNNENNTLTFCPNAAGERVAIAFTAFSTENNGNDACLDGLIIFNGNSVASPMVMPPAGSSGMWCWDRADVPAAGTGDLQDRTLVSTAADGCLTFLFSSDASGTRPGWEATVSCSANPGPPDNVLAQAGGLRVSDKVVVTGDGWHHFVHTSDNINLVSLKLDGTGAKFPPNGVSVHASGPGVIDLGTEGCGAPYTNNTHFYVFRRTWEGVPAMQPAAPVPVRFYYTTAEFNDVDAASPDISAHTDLSFFKINGGEEEDFTAPGNDCHQLVTPANYQEFDPGNWMYSSYGAAHSAQFSVASFSGGGGGGGTGAQGALPVELLFFNGKALDTHNLLQWASASERNCAWHIVERSVNGSTDWLEIGRLPGGGNASARLDYQWTDEHPLPLAYYRLRTLDVDGKNQRSEAQAIARPAGSFGIRRVFPNPASGAVTVLAELSGTAPLSGTLSDLHGAVVAAFAWDGVRGMNALALDVSGLAAGCYFLRLQDGSAVWVERVVKY